MTGRTLLALLVALAASCATASHANAAPLTDAEQQYVSALEAAGVYALDGDDTELATTGWETCDLLAHGETRGDVMGDILKNTVGRLSVDQARAEVDLATQYLCPSSPPTQES